MASPWNASEHALSSSGGSTKRAEAIVLSASLVSDASTSRAVGEGLTEHHHHNEHIALLDIRSAFANFDQLFAQCRYMNDRCCHTDKVDIRSHKSFDSWLRR